MKGTTRYWCAQTTLLGGLMSWLSQMLPAPTVARALDQPVFCYFGLPEQIHTTSKGISVLHGVASLLFINNLIDRKT